MNNLDRSIPVPKPGNIPQALKDCPNWTLWQLIPNKKDPQKFDKPPINPRGGGLGSSTDPSKWSDFAKVERMARMSKAELGIGFMFGNSPFVGIDIDKCRNAETGEIDQWALEIVDKLDSYTEISPSGTGLHVIIRGTKTHSKSAKKYKNGKVEVYENGRYFTVTGDRFVSTSPEVESRTKELSEICDKVFGAEQPLLAQKTYATTISNRSDREIIAKALNAQNGEKFSKLWSGDHSDYHSQSEADFALCALLAYWSDSNAETVDRLFRQSGLFRDKWDRLGSETINRAIASLPTKSKPKPPPLTVPAIGQTLTSSPPPPENLNKNRPKILITDQMRTVRNKSLRAILANNKPTKFFKRGDILTRIRKNDDEVLLQPIGSAEMRQLMTEAADFEKLDRKTLKPCFPPTAVAQDLLALDPNDLPIPKIIAATSYPVLSPDGEIIESGYDPRSGIFVHAKKLKRQKIGVSEAVKFIDQNLLTDFPFTDQASKANLWAEMLSPIVRFFTGCPLPLFAHNAFTEGTGKSLLATLTAIPYGSISALTFGKNEEETRKKITSLLVAGRGHILIDNVDTKLDSANLASVLTAENWEDRILGQTEMRRVPNQAIWIATGNNLNFSAEIARRTIWIQIDAKMERPYDRTEFKHKNILGWAKHNRSELLNALLTIIEHWLAEGMPTGKHTMGGYQKWASVMGGILETVGISDFLGNAEKVQSRDPFTEAMREFVQVWAEEFGAFDNAKDEWGYFDSDDGVWRENVKRLRIEGIGTADLFDLADNPDKKDAEDEIPDDKILTEFLGNGNERSRKTRLGKMIGKLENRVYNNYRIEKCGDASKTRTKLFKLIVV